MKSILVIGIGRFGAYLSKKLVDLGNEVMIVDKKEEKMREIMSVVTSAQIGDCTNEEVLKSIGVSNFDICFVCIGSDFQSSLEITSFLKELGAKYVVSKAKREVHAKFLLRNGADEVVYPERDIAEKAAIRYSASQVFDYIELTPEYSIVEIPPLRDWIGKTIEEASIRVKYQISILATKSEDNLYPLPKPTHIFSNEEHVIVAAKKKDLNKILNKIDKTI